MHRARGSGATLVCASGGLPGELHKLWPAGAPGSYHMEYGYSTMGGPFIGGWSGGGGGWSGGSGGGGGFSGFSGGGGGFGGGGAGSSW